MLSARIPLAFPLASRLPNRDSSAVAQKPLRTPFGGDTGSGNSWAFSLQVSFLVISSEVIDGTK
jgi:hypothetical protein